LDIESFIFKISHDSWRDGKIDLEDEGLISDLSQFGLTPLQAQLYLTLVKCGPSHARVLSSTLGINRVDVYRVLRGLQKLGLIEIILASPSKYSAIDPKRAIDLLIKDNENRLMKIKNRAQKLSSRIAAVSNTNFLPERIDDSAQHHFKLKYGWQVLDTLKILIDGAQREILVIWSGVGLRVHSAEGILEHFEKAFQRGVRIKAITETTSDDSDEIRLLNRITSLRISDNLLSSLRSITVDSKQVLLSATAAPPSESERMSLWTDNRAIVDGFVKDFDRLWQISLPVNAYRLDLKSR